MLSSLGTDPTFLERFAKGRWDIDYYAEHILGVKGHPGQSRMWAALLKRSPSRFRAAYLTICVSAGNRAGKTLGLAIAILHHCTYKIGLEPPDPTSRKSIESWLTADYQWFHFGIQQETAELVFNDAVRILQGTHEAQKGRGCPLTETLGVEVVAHDKKYRGDYPWLVFHPALGGAQVHFRTTSERATGSLGKDMHGISFDECAFDPQLDFVVDEVLHLRRLSTGGPLILISTATEGLTAFADRWHAGDPDYPDRRPYCYSLRMSTRENIGYGIDQEMFDRLIAGMPPYLIPQNIDGGFVEGKSSFFGSQAVDACFVDDLPEEDLPKDNHAYVHGVDPALTFDSSWAIVLDNTDPAHVTGVRVRRKTGRQTTLSVSAMVAEGHRAFNTGRTVCVTALDATGFGGKAFRDLLSDLHPFRAYEFGGTRGKKLKLLLTLKAYIEKGRLRFPRSGPWLALRRQLLGYRLDDRKLEQDAVMALAVAVAEAARHPAGGSETVELAYFAGDPARVSSPLVGRRATVMSFPIRRDLTE